MNFDGRTSSFDTKGFIFTVKCGLIAIGLIAFVHMGYVYFFPSSINDDPDNDSNSVKVKDVTYTDHTHLSMIDVVGKMTYSLLSDAGTAIKNFAQNISEKNDSILVTGTTAEESGGSQNINSDEKQLQSESHILTTEDLQIGEKSKVEQQDEVNAKKVKDAEQEVKKIENNDPATVLKKVKAVSYLVGDLDSGQIILEHNSDMVRPMASISKLMTAIVAKDKLNSLDEVVIDQVSIDTFGDAGGFVLGEVLTVDELMHSMIMESSNDAAVALSRFYDEGKKYNPSFVDLMNEQAKKFGMVNTHYDEPTGLSDGNYSTVNDLFTLAWRISTDKEEIYKISRLDKFDIGTTTKHHHHLMKNINPFVKDINFLGGKTGRTDTAKETMLTVFRVQNFAGAKSSKKIVIIVLGTDNRIRDTSLLKQWASLKK